MKCIIFYFSGTGNTELISRTLQKSLIGGFKKVELISVESITEDSSYDLNDTVVGLGFPVYKFTWPPVMKKVLSLLRRLRENSAKPLPFFVYSTYCRFKGSALHLMAREAEQYNMVYTGGKAFKCPSNGEAATQNSQTLLWKSVMYFEARPDKKCDRFSEKIISGVNKFLKKGIGKKHRGYFLDNYRIQLAGNIEKHGYPSLRINKDLCNKCLLCYKRCPEENFHFQKGMLCVHDQFNCLHCLRCMQHCPCHALSFTEAPEGPSRYTLKTRDSLWLSAINSSHSYLPGPLLQKLWGIKKLLIYTFR